MMLIDNFSWYLVLYLLKDKGETKDCIQNFVRLVQNQFVRKPQAIRSDREAEFVDKEVNSLHKEEGYGRSLLHATTLSKTALPSAEIGTCRRWQCACR